MLSLCFERSHKVSEPVDQISGLEHTKSFRTGRLSKRAVPQNTKF